jgi:predicted ester cyclase
MNRDAADLHRSFTDACNDHDLVTIRRLLDPRVTAWRPGHGVAHGADAVLAWWAEDFAAFPDLSVSTSLVLTQGSSVFSEAEVRGTNGAPIPRCPTDADGLGARFQIRVSTVEEWRDGRLLATRTYWDHYDLLRQLGLLPSVPA